MLFWTFALDVEGLNRSLAAGDFWLKNGRPIAAVKKLKISKLNSKNRIRFGL